MAMEFSEAHNICRICLSDISLNIHYIFDNLAEVPGAGIPSISDVLMQLTNIPINSDDNLPKTICTDCFDTTKICYDFRQKCIRAVDILNDRLANSIFEKQKIDDDNFGIEEQIGQTDDTVRTEYKQEPEVILDLEELHSDQVNIKKYDESFSDGQDNESIRAAELNSTEKIALIDIDENNLVCLKCMTTFSSNTKFNCHMENVHQDMIDREFESEQSDVQSIHFEKVENCSKSEALFSCLLCSRYFLARKCLVQHNKKFHPNDDMKEINKCYFCAVCKKSLWVKRRFDRHMNRRHMNKDGFHICEICGTAFNSTKTFKDHMDSHTESRPYTCKVCHVKFRHRSSYFTHRQRHTIVKHKYNTRAGR